MVKNKDLQYFMNLDYSVILRRKGVFYYSFIPELSIIAVGKDAGDSYKNLEQEKEAYFKKMIEIGNVEMIKEPLPMRIRNRLLEELGMFFAKTFLATLIITVFFLGSLPFVNDVLISSRLNRIPSQIKMETELFVEKWEAMPPKDKEKMKQRVRKLVDEIRPFIEEIQKPGDKSAGKKSL